MKETQLIQLKIHLLDISPQIYRKFVVCDTTTIAQLHHLIQIIMGWKGYHLHQFHIFGKYYGIYYSGGMSFSSNPCEVTLSSFDFSKGDKFTYCYNFYDNWKHEIRIEKLTSLPADYQCPKVLEGKRACPIEDIGGAERYQQAIINQHCWMYEWACYLAECLETNEVPKLDADSFPYWYLTHRSEEYNKAKINGAIEKLYQQKGDCSFWRNLRDYYDFLEE